MKSKVDGMVCKKCGVYYPRIAAMKHHHKVEHSKPDKEIGYIDNESDSSVSDSENDPWEDMNEEPIDDDYDVMPLQNS